MTIEELAIVVPASVAVLALAISALLQVKIHRQTVKSQRTLAQQERVGKTYEDMLHMVSWSMGFAEMLEPSTRGVGELPEGPGTDRVRSMHARVAVHGSAEVKTIFVNWARQRETLASAFDEYQIMLRGGLGPVGDDQLGAEWEKVDGARRKLKGIVGKLEGKVNEEMRA